MLTVDTLHLILASEPATTRWSKRHTRHIRIDLKILPHAALNVRLCVECRHWNNYARVDASVGEHDQRARKGVSPAV